MSTTNLNIDYLVDSQAQKTVTVNEALDALDGVLGNLLAVTMTDANHTVADADALGNLVFVFTGTLTANRNIIVPTNKKLYIVRNSTTGSHSIVVKTSSGTGITLAVSSTSYTLLYCDGTNVVQVGGSSGGSGTVTSVAVTVPSFLTVSGSPITTSGTVAISATTGLTANSVLATPDGTTGALSVRLLVAADIPNLAASKITTGALALARGGTGVDLSASGSSTAILAQDASHVISARALTAADIPSLAASILTSGQVALARGGTNADLSATGGTSKFLKQASSGAAITVVQPASTDLSDVASLELVAHKDAASGYAGLDADTQVLSVELPNWLIEGMNNAIVRGPVDGSGNPFYGAISTVSTVATFKFVCNTVNLEMWIAGRYQKVADDNVVVVTLVNGSGATAPAANFVYLKQNASVKQLTASDIGVTSKAPIFGNNQTQPSVYAGADKQFWFNPATNKWMSSTGSAAYVNDPIIPVAVCVIDNTGVELGTAYWGPRMTPWKVMELFGQGTDGVKHNQTGSTTITGRKQYTSFISSGGTTLTGAIASVQDVTSIVSQAPIVICGSSTVNSNGKGASGGAAATNAASNAGSMGVTASGGGGGGSTARAGAVSGGRATCLQQSGSGTANASSAAGGAVTPTAGSNGSSANGAWRPWVLGYGTMGMYGGGGGGGGSDNTNAGGAGGAGGGHIALYAPGVVVASGSTLAANGANGSNGPAGNSAGGGGGGGGYVGMYAQYFLISGTNTVTGGSAGTGSGTGASGGSGGTGILETVKCF